MYDQSLSKYNQRVPSAFASSNQLTRYRIWKVRWLIVMRVLSRDQRPKLGKNPEPYNREDESRSFNDRYGGGGELERRRHSGGTWLTQFVRQQAGI